jgi:hypothetical protein
MTKYVITFDAHAMADISQEDLLSVADAAHAVVQEIVNAGAYVLAGGLASEWGWVVATDGSVTDGPSPDGIGGVTIVDVPSREEALQWAAKIAIACRCDQEVWEFGHDPQLEAMIRDADKQT